MTLQGRIAKWFWSLGAPDWVVVAVYKVGSWVSRRVFEFHVMVAIVGLNK